MQGTNDSSAVSKVSAAAQGYFHDDFLKYFVCKLSRRAPLINRGYYVRWRAIDHCVRQFLQVTEDCRRSQVKYFLPNREAVHCILQVPDIICSNFFSVSLVL